MARSVRSEGDAARRLTSRQLELLGLFRVSGVRAEFSAGERINDWPAIKQVFTLLGATWKRGTKGAEGAFVFPDDTDARGVVELALATGQVLDPRKAGAFFTPPEVARYVLEQAGVRDRYLYTPRLRVLEPSAGNGALVEGLAEILPEVREEVDAYELLATHREVLLRKKISVVGEDFLSADPSTSTRYDLVVMNPPFEGKADIAHVMHAYDFLKKGGLLVAIMSAGTLFRTDLLTANFRAFVQRASGRIDSLPPGSFQASGTGVNTCFVVLDKK